MSLQSTTGNDALKEFKNLQGEQFGGRANYLQMEVNQVIGPIVHVRIDKAVKLTDDTKPIDLHVGLVNGEEMRLPAAAIFCRNAEEAKLHPGDEYYVARMPDAIKQTGSKATGKGKPMEVYALKVTKRVKKKS